MINKCSNFSNRISDVAIRWFRNETKNDALTKHDKKSCSKCFSRVGTDEFLNQPMMDIDQLISTFRVHIRLH